MKKLLLCLGVLLMLAGCGKYTKDDIIKDFEKQVTESNSYLLTGTLEIYRNEDLYTYDIKSAYMAKDYFKVSLTNTTNNHEQLILKNADGVYVVTPSLNKSFKFQSEWPYNNSQIYLLQPIITDLQSDNDIKLEEDDNTYILTFKANYINDKSLIKQKVYFDKNLNLKKVEVLDSNEDVIMRLKVEKIAMNYEFSEDYFELDTAEEEEESNISDTESDSSSESTNPSESEGDSSNESTNSSETEDDSSSESSTTTSLDVNEILYPMYVPVNTYLDSQDVVAIDEGSRTILTFAGASPFTLIQSSISNDVNNYVYGDPYLINDTVGAMTDNSLSWISNSQEYYLTSSVMDVDELLLVAQSLNVTEIGK